MNYLLFFLIFLLPFVVLPMGVSPFESAKIYATEIAVGILILWYLWKHPVQSLLQKKYLFFYLLFLLGIIQLFFFHTETSLFGNVFRQQGIFLYLLLLLFAIISSTVVLRIPSKRTIVILLGIQLLCALLIQSKADFRAIGTLGEANSLAAYAVFLVPFLVYNPTKKEHFVWQSFGIAFASIIILISGSRSGAIALILISIFFFLQKRSLVTAVVVSLLLFGASHVLPFLQHDQLFENRATVWQTAYVAGTTHPLLGWGIGNTELALHETGSRLSNTLRFEYVDHTHNLFLEAFVYGGIIGLGLFTLIIIRSGKTLLHKKNALGFSLLLGLVTMMAFNPLSVALMVQFWFILGLSLQGEKS